MGYENKYHTTDLSIPDIETLPGACLLTRRQVSEITGFAIVTLALWERQNRGPKTCRVEGLPRYRVGDVRKWLKGDANKQTPCPRAQETV